MDAWYSGRYFVPFPAASTRKPHARAQSTSSQISAGWSPYASEYTTPRAFRLPRQRNTREHVGFNIDHHDVLALGDRASRVRDAGGGVAGRLHRDLDITGEHRSRIVGEVSGGDAFLGPANTAAGLARPIRCQVGNRNDLDSWRGWHLRQEHGAEFPRPDQPDAHRPTSLPALA